MQHISRYYLVNGTHQAGILTRPGKSEAEVEAEVRCYEAEAEADARDVA